MNNPQVIHVVTITNRQTGKTIGVLPVYVATREVAKRQAIATLLAISVVRLKVPPVGLESVEGGHVVTIKSRQTGKTIAVLPVACPSRERAKRQAITRLLGISVVRLSVEGGSGN